MNRPYQMIVCQDNLRYFMGPLIDILARHGLSEMEVYQLFDKYLETAFINISEKGYLSVGQFSIATSPIMGHYYEDWLHQCVDGIDRGGHVQLDNGFVSFEITSEDFMHFVDETFRKYFAHLMSGPVLMALTTDQTPLAEIKSAAFCYPPIYPLYMVRLTLGPWDLKDPFEDRIEMEYDRMLAESDYAERNTFT